MSPSVLAKTAEIVWVLLESYNINPLPSFQKAGINPSVMGDINARLDQSSMDALWRNAAMRVDDPSFGLRASKIWHPSYLHALGYAWLASPTLRTGVERLARYTSIVSSSTKVVIIENDEKLSIKWHNKTRAQDDYWHGNTTMAILLAMCRANYGQELDPVMVKFIHAEPERTGEFYDLFRCPVSFGAEHNELILTNETADKLLPSSNPLMEKINDQEIIKYLAKLDKDDIIHQVKATILMVLHDGGISAVKVSEELNMSRRTLLRRLKAENTTFIEILTEVRRELAMKYIRDSHLTLTELSFQLGFSEMSSFSRAFKSWTGQAPAAYRKSI